MCENARDMAKNHRQIQKRRARKKQQREVSRSRRVRPSQHPGKAISQDRSQGAQDGYRDPWEEWTGSADAYTEFWSANPFEMMRRTDGLSGPGARVSVRLVLSLSEDVLLERLRALGLHANAHMFQSHVCPLGSAWRLPRELWPAQVAQLQPGEQDFVSAASCALWSIWFPNVPSSETVVDSMLDFQRAARLPHAAGAVDCWARMWAHISPHLEGVETETELAECLDDCHINPYELVKVAKALPREHQREISTALRLLEEFHAALVPSYLDEEDADEAGSYRHQYATMLNLAGYPARADEVLAKQIEVAPDSPWSYLTAADFFIERGNPEDLLRAREMVERASNLDAPEDSIEDYRAMLDGVRPQRQ